MTEVLVVGAGFGGLAAALTLAERGVPVTLCEALDYPGGCASTFTRDGYRFETGATLFSGFAEGQLFHRWIRNHRLPITFMPLDPLVELRTPAFRLAVPAQREALLATFATFPEAPMAQLREFFELQRNVADALWPIFDDPARLPPFSFEALAWHLGRSLRYPSVLRWMGRPLLDVLAKHQLDRWAPLRVWADALCQITVQTSASKAEAPLALSALDYGFRGTGHVHGGIGKLAWAMVDAIRALGGKVQLACRVKKLERKKGGWAADTRHGEILAHEVIANVLPQTVAELRGRSNRTLDQLGAPVSQSWGAMMLYLALNDAEELPRGPFHWELVADPEQPYTDGNHLFVSVSGASEADRGPKGTRTATVSTHAPATATDPEASSLRIQNQMRRTLALLAPELTGKVVHELTASPRTFERFTRRPHGWVGGIPRTIGLHHYRRLGPVASERGLWLVGDSVFPGQSTLATAVGGARTALSLSAFRAPLVRPA